MSSNGDFGFKYPARVLCEYIIDGFLASDELEVELVDVPENVTVDGYPVRAMEWDAEGMRDRFRRIIKEKGLGDQIRVRITRKQGGHVWLQKVGAEMYPERLSSEKISPYWSKGDKRGGSCGKRKTN